MSLEYENTLRYVNVQFALKVTFASATHRRARPPKLHPRVSLVMETPINGQHIYKRGVYANQVALGQASAKMTHVYGATSKQDGSEFGRL